MYFDFHTHSLPTQGIMNVRVGVDTAVPPCPFSAAIHPWDVERLPAHEALQQLQHLLAHPQCVAIGELGLDKACHASMALQHSMLHAQLRLLSNSSQNIVITHAVRSYADIIALKKQYSPQLQWVIHGFRGHAQTAQQLMAQGFYLSMGAALLHASDKLKKALQSIDLQHLLLETDDSQQPIELIYRQAAQILSIDEDKLQSIILHNISKLGLPMKT